MQKARRHPEGLRPLVSVWFQVLFHSPNRGACHHSVALLVNYRSSSSTLAWRVDPPCSIRVPRDRIYSRPHSTGATGLSPSLVRLSSRLTPYAALSVFARRYLRSRGCFPFLRVLRCFSSPGSLPAPMHSGQDDPQRAGFPHSDILGSQLASNSPRLFAGSHVFHRLSTPRHPPYALAGLFMLTGRRRARAAPPLSQPRNPLPTRR